MLLGEIKCVQHSFIYLIINKWIFRPLNEKNASTPSLAHELRFLGLSLRSTVGSSLPSSVPWDTDGHVPCHQISLLYICLVWPVERKLMLYLHPAPFYLAFRMPALAKFSSHPRSPSSFRSVGSKEFSFSELCPFS